MAEGTSGYTDGLKSQMTVEERQHRDAIDSNTVRFHIDQQRKLLAELHDTIDFISNQLEPVLSPDEEMKSSGEKDPNQGWASVPPVVRDLREGNDSIANAKRRLSSIIKRVAL